MAEFNVGDKVRFADHGVPLGRSDVYPPYGTEGTVVGKTFCGELYIRWPEGALTDKCRISTILPCRLEAVTGGDES